MPKADRITKPELASFKEGLTELFAGDPLKLLLVRCLVVKSGQPYFDPELFRVLAKDHHYSTAKYHFMAASEIEDRFRAITYQVVNIMMKGKKDALIRK